jgi:hypothetical protein
MQGDGLSRLPTSKRYAMTDTRRDATGALVLALLSAALLSQDADAQSDRKSANFFVPVCQKYLANSGEDTDPRSNFNEGMCSGLVQGLTYLIKYLPPGERACPPKGVAEGQVVRVALAHIERRPQRMHEDFRDLHRSDA